MKTVYTFAVSMLVLTSCGAPTPGGGDSTPATAIVSVAPSPSPVPTVTPSPSPSPSPVCKSFSGTWDGVLPTLGHATLHFTGMQMNATQSLDWETTYNGETLHCFYNTTITPTQMTLDYTGQSVIYNDFFCPNSIVVTDPHGNVTSITTEGPFVMPIVSETCTALTLSLNTQPFTMN